MIWPFKPRPARTLAETAALEPPTPCGQPESHLNYKLNGVECPDCLDIRQQQRDDRLAEAIATAVVAKLQGTAPAPSPAKPLTDAQKHEQELVRRAAWNESDGEPLNAPARELIRLSRKGGNSHE